MKPSRQLVIEKIRLYWPDSVDAVVSELDEIRRDDTTDEGLARVQLAVIKLSEGVRQKLADNIRAAIQDYRDVLAYAEFPKEMAAVHLFHFNMSADEQIHAKAILKSDREQYEAWLTGNE